MIDEAEALKERWYITGRDGHWRCTEAIRNYNAMCGVVKSLRWAFYKGESPLN